VKVEPLLNEGKVFFFISYLGILFDFAHRCLLSLFFFTGLVSLVVSSPVKKSYLAPFPLIARTISDPPLPLPLRILGTELVQPP